MSDVEKQIGSRDPGITVSSVAKDHFVSYMTKQAGCCGVRLSVKKTGCSGYSYVVDYVMTASEDDLVCPLDSVYHLYVDKKSLPYLKGLTIDYVKQGFNYKLVFSNPNQTGECGCGESFTTS